MLSQLEESLHLTESGLMVELAGRRYRVSPNTMWSLLRKAGHSFKKACSPASRIARRSRDGWRSGRNTKTDLIPGGWSSLTKGDRMSVFRGSMGPEGGQDQHGPRSRAGRSAAASLSPRPRPEIGRRWPSSRRCAATRLKRPACSMGRSAVSSSLFTAYVE